MVERETQDDVIIQASMFKGKADEQIEINRMGARGTSHLPEGDRTSAVKRLLANDPALEGANFEESLRYKKARDMEIQSKKTR